MSEWITFTRRTNEPKLSDLKKRLDDKGIPHRQERASFHAPIIEVPVDRIEEANRILDVVIDMGDGIHQEYDEIPDDDPMFTPF